MANREQFTYLFSDVQSHGPMTQIDQPKFMESTFFDGELLLRRTRNHSTKTTKIVLMNCKCSTRNAILQKQQNFMSHYWLIYAHNKKKDRCNLVWPKCRRYKRV